LAAHRHANHDARFFLKLSMQTLMDESTAQFVMTCLRETKLPGDAIIFEFPEQAASQHLNQAKSFIQHMRQCGVRTALEHFGNSPSSFQLLKHLPVDYLKIDGTLIHNLASNNENQESVRNIIETARDMEMKCIAEFVEDPHSLAVLWQNGIDYIQGNFLQEPSELLEYDFTSEIA
jgi:EAL domain-containing protein (putative c-di-GMP-specific phosphodiesterase class I)